MSVSNSRVYEIQEFRKDQYSRYPYNCIARITVYDGANNNIYLNGILLSETTILTSAHLFFKHQTGSNTPIILTPHVCHFNLGLEITQVIEVQDFRYKKQFKNLFGEISKATQSNNRQKASQLIAKSAPYDYALLKLRKKVILQKSHYPVLCRATESGKSVDIVGHAFDSAGMPTKYRTNTQMLLRQDKKRAEYDAVLCAGMSGSPIFSIVPKEDPEDNYECRVYGIHQAYNSSSRCSMGVLITSDLCSDIRKWQAEMGIACAFLNYQPSEQSKVVSLQKQVVDLKQQLRNKDDQIKQLRKIASDVGQEMYNKYNSLLQDAKNTMQRLQDQLNDLTNADISQSFPVLHERNIDYWAKGQHFQIQQRWYDAAHCYRTHLRLNPSKKTPQLLYNLAYCIHQSDPVTEMISYCLDSLERKVDSEEVYKLIRNILLDKDKREARIIKCQKAMEFYIKHFPHIVYATVLQLQLIRQFAKIRKK